MHFWLGIVFSALWVRVLRLFTCEEGMIGRMDMKSQTHLIGINLLGGAKRVVDMRPLARRAVNGWGRMGEKSRWGWSLCEALYVWLWLAMSSGC